MKPSIHRSIAHVNHLVVFCTVAVLLTCAQRAVAQNAVGGESAQPPSAVAPGGIREDQGKPASGVDGGHAPLSSGVWSQQDVGRNDPPQTVVVPVDSINERLLSIIKTLLRHDEGAIATYVRSEVGLSAGEITERRLRYAEALAKQVVDQLKRQ